MFVVFEEVTHQFRLVVARYGTDRNRHDDRGCMEVIVNQNRLLVTAHDSHITEERRIEEKMIEVDDRLTHRYEALKTYLQHNNWNMIIQMSGQVSELAGKLWLMEQRLQDVKQINEQFARIQVHIDRIEATEEKGK